MLTRAVVLSRPDPADNRRRIYLLDCGHEITRRYTATGKRIAVCGLCDTADELERQINLIRARNAALDAGEYERADRLAAILTGD